MSPDSSLTHLLTANPGCPGLLEIGTRGGEVVSLDLSSTGALGLVGSTAVEVVRMWCATLLSTPNPGAAEVLISARLASSLFPGLQTTTALRTPTTPETLLQSIEAEILGRSRRLAEAALVDAASYRSVHPEDPLPFLLVVVDRVPEGMADRWRPACDSVERLDVAVVVLGDRVPASAQIVTGTEREVTSASPDELDHALKGVTLFGLGASEAVELIGTVFANQDAGAENDVSETSDDSPVPEPTAGQLTEDWPAETTKTEEQARPAIRVRLLGPYRVTVCDQEIAKGLRSAAKELLAWYLLRPEGATAEAAVEALWPDTAPDLISKRFWRALGDLRSRLRHDDSPVRHEVLVRSGDHYRPIAEEIACDLWDFQRHLDEAYSALDDDGTRSALRAAVDAYQGDFASGTDYLWVESVREDLHRRALDAHLRLAELEEASGRDDAALDVLERAVRLDHYAEEVFRRLMALQNRMERPDSVRTTWHQLQRNLAELGVEPEPETIRLNQNLASREQDQLLRS